MNRNRKLIEFWTKYRVPFVYDDTVSLYQLVLKVIKHLNLMIDDQNELKDIIKEFIQAFDEDLQETVEEILVQWEGDGKLKKIINQALFESKLDKEEFENYKHSQMQLDVSQNNKIDDIENELTNLDVKNDNEHKEINKNIESKLSKKSFDEFKDQNYKDIENKVKTRIPEGVRYYTDHIVNKNGNKNLVHVVEIPYYNSDGTRNIIKKDFANGGWGKGYSTAIEFDDMVKPFLTINAGFLNYEKPYTTNIHNGKVLYHHKTDDTAINHLAWDKDGMLSVHPRNSNPYDLVNKGVTNLIRAWSPIIIDSKIRPDLWNKSNSQGDVQVDPHPRTTIGQLNNKDYVIISTSGRDKPHQFDVQEGLGNQEIGEYALKKWGNIGVRILYQADGGGSSQLVLNGVEKLPPIDKAHSERRVNGEFIYFKRENKSVLDDILKNFLDSNRYMSKDITDLKNKFYMLNNVTFPSNTGEHGVTDDLDTIKHTSIYYGSVKWSKHLPGTLVNDFFIVITVQTQYPMAFQVLIGAPGRGHAEKSQIFARSLDKNRDVWSWWFGVDLNVDRSYK